MYVSNFHPLEKDVGHQSRSRAGNLTISLVTLLFIFWTLVIVVKSKFNSLSLLSN